MSALPTEVTTDVLLDFKPYPHQRAAHALRLVFRFLVLVWHRRAGKTVWSVLELLLAAASCTKPRGRFAYIAPLLSQAKDVAWEYLKHYAAAIPGCRINESELWVELPNGARVRLYGADNPDRLRGIYLDGVVADEVADWKKQMWGEILRPCLTDRQGWAIFIGTPKGVNLFSELYYKAIAGKEPGWKGDLRRASETGVLAADELEKARREMSDAQFAQEMDCDFAAAVDNVLLKLDEVLAAQKRTVKLEHYHYAAKVIGIDVARLGGDRSVLMLRQGLVAFTPRVLKPQGLMETSSQAAEFIDKHKPDAVFVDLGGMGGGVVDRLRQLGFRVVDVNFGGKPLDPRFAYKRDEMWWLMADWVKAGGCLPSGNEIAEDLIAPQFSYANARDRFQLESKDDMRARGLKSPDIGDALALTFAFPVAQPGLAHARARLKSATGQRKYDPYSRRN